MLYTDLIFIYGFLPLTLLLTFLDRSTEYKNLILCLSSAVFFSWGRPLIVLLLFATVIFDWLFGLIAGRARAKGLRALGFLGSIVMNSSVFVVFCWNTLFKASNPLSFSQKMIPFCIAFYTLKGISYVGDVFYKRIKAERNFFCLLTYMMSYHFMLAGPIVRYGDVEKDIRKRSVSGQDLNDGLTRFVTGLFKAVVMGGSFYKIAASGLDAGDFSALGSWLGMFAFMGAVYYTFSGYTDMALALGRLNGFKYKENVLPIRLSGYVSGAVSGFNRSLFDFFSDFIYKPFSKLGLSWKISGIFCASMLAALWYGLKENYFFFGLYIAALIALEKLFLAELLKKLPKFIGWIYTLAAAFFGFGILYFDRLSDFKAWGASLFGKGSGAIISETVKNNVLAYLFLCVIGVLLLFPALKSMIVKAVNRFTKDNETRYGAVRICQTAGLVLLLLMSTAAQALS